MSHAKTKYNIPNESRKQLNLHNTLISKIGLTTFLNSNLNKSLDHRTFLVFSRHLNECLDLGVNGVYPV
jgi:hypothetical protein